jgi:hypothetical protein
VPIITECQVKDHIIWNPADFAKEGSAYDLTLTIGILVASANHCRPRKYVNGRTFHWKLTAYSWCFAHCHQSKGGGFKGFFTKV